MSEEKKLKTMTVHLKRVDDAFHFEALGGDPVPVHIDAAATIGGSHAGARPMELLLMGLGGCTAIDVILILKKARQNFTDFNITVSGQREVDATPAPFINIHIDYHLKGTLKADKVEQAIRLSMEKYCSATAMLEKTATITWALQIDN